MELRGRRGDFWGVGLLRAIECRGSCSGGLCGAVCGVYLRFGLW